MRDHGLVILKVFLASGIISILIKQVGPHLPIAPTAVNALILVLLPSVVLAIFLIFQLKTTPPIRSPRLD